MGREPDKACDFAKGQKIGLTEAIKNLKVSCIFQTCLCLL